jgi:hypothetical protein
VAKPELKIISVDRGRDIEANDVHAHFAEKTERVLVQCERMAGFAIVAWDDEGVAEIEYHQGKNSPLPSMMVPRLVKDYLTVFFARGE